MLKIVILIFFISIYVFESKAQLNKDIQRGDAYYKIGQYINAVKYYEIGIRKGNASYVYAQLADCYRKLNRPEWSVMYLNKLKAKTGFTESNQLALCKVLMMVGKYKQAKIEIKKLLKKYPTKENYAHIAASCDSALYWLAIENEDVTIENLTKINTSFSEISPYVNNNELYFASNKEDFIIKNRPGGDELPFYDLYKAQINPLGNVSKPKLVPLSLKGDMHKSSISINAEGSKAYFTQHVMNDTLEATHARLKIFFMENVKGKWANAHSFVFNDTVSSFAHPFLTGDGKIFFFVSDMKGGYGGSDIYFCVLKDSLWSLPINIGEPINTPGNEIYPFYDEERRKLYFASDNHLGMGGYDIFEAQENNGTFFVRNMRPPINSSFDDFGFVFDWKNSNRFFFVSNRKGGKGLEDIYMIKIK